MRLSVLIPWSNRQELEVSIRRNKAVFNSHHSEIIIINCGGSEETLKRYVENVGIDRLRIVQLPGDRFDKSLALNIGAHIARGQCLLSLDADVVLIGDFFQEAMAEVQERKFVCIDRVFESAAKAGEGSESLFLSEYLQTVVIKGTNGAEALLVTNQFRFRENSRSAAGLVFVSRSDFIEVGGLNSELRGWGWEDLDFLARLQLRIGIKGARLGSVIHLTHGESFRDWNGVNHLETEQVNHQQCLLNYCSGELQGSYESDVELWREKVEVEEMGSISLGAPGWGRGGQTDVG